jgi:hypothetical protein
VVELEQLEARLSRLSSIGLTLAQESNLWDDGGELLLAQERRDFLDGLYAAIAEIDRTWSVLARARRRIKDPPVFLTGLSLVPQEEEAVTHDAE